MHIRFKAPLVLVALALGLHSLSAQDQATSMPATSLYDGPASGVHTESWSSIDLPGSGLKLKATGGVVLSKVDLPGCTRELVRLQWRLNDPIDLYVIRPISAKPLPVVLFLYNYTYDTDVFRADRWCDRAKENGFAVAGFPSALSQPRIRAPRPMKEWFVSQLQEALATSTHDVQMVLNQLATRGDIDMSRVGVFGQGSGGAVAILAAAADARIKAVDVMDPWGDWAAWLRGSEQIPAQERATYLQPRFVESVSNLDPVLYLPRLSGRALRIQQRMDDVATPPEARENIAAAASQAGPGERKVAVERFATLSAETQALGSNGILAWFGEQLCRRNSQTP